MGEPGRGGNSTDEAPRYVRYVHPEGCFEIDYPSHWRTEVDRDGAVNIWPGNRSDVAISFFRMPVPVDTRTIIESGKGELAMRTLLEKVASQNIRPDPSVIYPCMTADWKEGGQGGQRWVVMQDDLVLGISTTFPAGERHIYQPLFERMLSSFRINRKKEGLWIHAVTRVISKLTEEFPDEEFKLSGEAIRGKDYEFSLVNLVRQIEKQPYALESLCNGFLDGLRSIIQQRGKIGCEAWEEVRDRVVPLIEPDRRVRELDEREILPERRATSIASQVVASPWLADLVICYGVRSRHAFRLINRNDLDRWQISADSLHVTALDNLINVEEAQFVCVPAPGGKGGFGMFRTKQVAASSYLLHPQLYQRVAPRLGNQLLAAIPARDVLVVFSEGTVPRRAIEETVRGDYECSEHPITERLFRLTPDGVTLA